MLQPIRLGLDHFLHMIDPFRVWYGFAFMRYNFGKCCDCLFISTNVLSRLGFGDSGFESLRRKVGRTGAYEIQAIESCPTYRNESPSDGSHITILR